MWELLQILPDLGNSYVPEDTGTWLAAAWTVPTTVLSPSSILRLIPLSFRQVKNSTRLSKFYYSIFKHFFLIAWSLRLSNLKFLTTGSACRRSRGCGPVHSMRNIHTNETSVSLEDFRICLDFKLLSCCECCIASFGWFPVRLNFIYRRFVTLCLFHRHRWCEQ